MRNLENVKYYLGKMSVEKFKEIVLEGQLFTVDSIFQRDVEEIISILDYKGDYNKIFKNSKGKLQDLNSSPSSSDSFDMIFELKEDAENAVKWLINQGGPNLQNVKISEVNENDYAVKFNASFKVSN